MLISFSLCSAIATAEAPAPWVEFRGPTADGHAPDDSTPPTLWSETENILWKTETPLSGWSTPVVMQDQIWFTAANEDGKEYFGLGVDFKTGEIFYHEKLFHCDTPDPLGNSVNGYASPSPAIEEGRVYLNFGRYGTACIDTQSLETLWKRNDLPCNHYRGPGSSVVLHDGLLVLTLDGSDLQYTVALDTDTGKTVWKTDRSTEWDDYDENGEIIREGDLRKAFSTPILYTHQGKPTLLSLGSSALFSYDLKTGKEHWRIPNPGFGPSVRPILSGTSAIIQTGYGETVLRALDFNTLDASGLPQELWHMRGKQIPNTPSPILVDDLLYLMSDRGILTCVELDSGKEVWSERIGGSYIASPIYAGGHIYCATNRGNTTVFKPGRSYEHVATNTLDDGLMASPVVYGDNLILRTKTHLYRIADTK